MRILSLSSFAGLVLLNLARHSAAKKLRNRHTRHFKIIHDCGIVIMLDLDQRLTTRDDFLAVQQFLKGMINTCQSRGVGHLIIFNKLFDDVRAFGFPLNLY